jgi:hypothetical protein
MVLVAPDGEEQRALQHERVGVGRSGQAVEDSLDRVPREDQLEVLAVLARMIQQTLADGSGEVAARPRAQTWASR